MMGCWDSQSNNGLHEYELLGDEKRTLALTLLRCVEWIYDKDFDYPMEETRIPEAQCLGRRFEFAVYPHQGNHYAGRLPVCAAYSIHCVPWSIPVTASCGKKGALGCKIP